MNTSFETKLRIIVILMTIVPLQINAKVTHCNNLDPGYEYLDENVVFCFTQDSLSTYMDMAEIFDLDGMNYLIRTGECNFVPTGKYLPVESYISKTIKSTPVIAAEMGDLTLWTFKKLVSYGNPEVPTTISGDSTVLALAMDDQSTDQCRCFNS